LAVVTLKPSKQGRYYRLPMERDYEAVWKAQKRIKEILDEWERNGRKDLYPVPNEPLPSPPGKNQKTKEAYYNYIPLQLYGFESWSHLFTARQQLALVTLTRLVREYLPTVGITLGSVMALVVNRYVDYNSANCRWISHGEFVGNTFTRQALPIVWDFAEVPPSSEATGGILGALDWVAEVIASLLISTAGQIQLADAAEYPLPDETAHVWFTDPPYYDAVPYADLSDFFFVWLKRALPGHPLLHDPFDPSNQMTPKVKEIIDTLQLLRGVPKKKAKQLGLKVKDKSFYEHRIATAFAEGRRVLYEGGIGAVVFAHKTTEGWEALLSGIIRGGWTITASWPIATEREARLRAQESAALATSVHLILRPRPEDAPVGDWEDVLRELPRRVREWMERLQGEGIRGADLVFACIGPALEIFSRYSRVETAEGTEVTLDKYLEKVWEVVGRIALEQVLGTEAAGGEGTAPPTLEEDARLTALFLWTLQSTELNEGNNTLKEANEEYEEEDEWDEEEEPKRKKKGGLSLPFDVVRRFAQPLGIHLPIWEGRIIETKKGIVRLLSIKERAKILFGREDAEAFAERLEKATQKGLQLELFPAREAGESRPRSRRRIRVLSEEALQQARGATTLDRVHVAMLLQATGQTNALRSLIASELERGPEFLRLANALSALYPRGCEEKRLIDAMLLAVPK